MYDDAELEMCEERLARYLKRSSAGYEMHHAGECFVVLGDLRQAERCQSRALKLFLNISHDCGITTGLLHSYLLSRQSHRRKAVTTRISTILHDRERLHPADHYALAVLRIFHHDDVDIGEHTSSLLECPSGSDHRMVGLALSSVVNGNRRSLRDALIRLLYDFQLTRGSTYVPGLLCARSMALARVALHRGMEVDIRCRYYSGDYVAFLERCRGPLRRCARRSRSC